MMAANDIENILQFRETFNLQSFIQKHLASDNRDAEYHVLNAHVVGQEGDGSVLVSWDGKESNESPYLVTKVGHYATVQGKPVYQELYKYNERVHIVSATVNSPLTLLAFTIVKGEGGRDGGGDTSYLSLCAEIHPQGRTFTLELNCDFTLSRKLQFLPQGSTTPKSSNNNTAVRQSRHGHHGNSNVAPSSSCLVYSSKLLVVVPGAYITTYTITLQQAHNVSQGGGTTTPRTTGMMIMDFEEDKPPVTPHPLDWYQWDPKQQWLYYARLESKPNLLILSCIAFTSNPYEQVFSLCLNLPYPSDRYKTGPHPSTSSSSVATPPQWPTPQIDLTTPARHLNIQVVHSRKEDHLMCVCMQHCSKESPMTTTQGDNSADYDYVLAVEEMVEYSVYMIHNRHVIHGQVPFSVLPTSNLRIHFMMVGKFLTAYIPGVMLHLLNVHPQVDPCHHLVLEPGLSPPLPVVAGGVGPGVTAPARTYSSSFSSSSSSFVGWREPLLCNAVCAQSSFETTSVLDCLSQIIYECILCPGALLGMFKATESTSLRIDLLHLAIVSLRLQNLALSMVEHVCLSPVTLDTHQIFAEFILAFAYNNTLVSHVQRFITSQLPLTTTWPSFNGGVYRNEGVYAYLKIALIDESFVKRLQVMVQVSQHKLESAEDLLACKIGTDGSEAIQDLLYFNVITTQPRLKRVKISSLVDYHDSHAATGQAASVPKRIGPFRRIIGVVRAATIGKVQKLTPTGLPFLEPDSDLDAQINVANQNLKDVLVSAIGSQLASSSRSIVRDQLDTFYIPELGRESCELLKVVWQSLGLGRDTHPLNNTLYRQATPLEQILFDLLEAYLHAHSELCIPTPSGFHTLYTCLGFMCLEPVVFLQYFAHGGFQITMNFVEKAVQSSDDAHLQEGSGERGETRRRDELLYNVICDLPEPERSKAFASWSNPEVKLMVCATQEDGR